MKKSILIAVLCVSVGSPAWAGVTGLWNTGVDDSGMVLVDGQADMHYLLTAVPSGPSTSIAVAPHPNWVTPPAGSKWIAPTSYTTPDADGTYTYDLTFTVMDVERLTITGRWATDNTGKIYLNGVDTGITRTGTQQFVDLVPFEISSGFIMNGVNTLRFEIGNLPGTGTNPTGLLVSDMTATIPAPGAILLGTLGTGLVGWMRRRRTL